MAHIPRSRGDRDSPVVLCDSMLLPIHNDPENALLHLKVLVLAEVDVQRRAGLALADALIAQIMRLAHGAEAGAILDEVVQYRILGGGDGGVVGRGRALRRAGRQPLLQPAWWHISGTACRSLPSQAGGEKTYTVAGRVRVGRREPSVVMESETLGF